MGLFHPFYKDKAVKMIGVEAAGAASLSAGKPGILHGALSYLLQDKDGQVLPTHSISAGLDYPGVGPEHSYFKDSGRAQYASATDKEALAGFQLLSRTEGIIPALEPAHAIGYLMNRAKKFDKRGSIVVCLSGRGDKDVMEVQRILDKLK